jgi:hypothetical protein
MSALMRGGSREGGGRVRFTRQAPVFPLGCVVLSFFPATTFKKLQFTSLSDFFLSLIREPVFVCKSEGDRVTLFLSFSVTQDSVNPLSALCVRACVWAQRMVGNTLDLKTREKEIVLASFNQPNSHTHTRMDEIMMRSSSFLFHSFCPRSYLTSMCCYCYSCCTYVRRKSKATTSRDLSGLEGWV